MRRGRTSSIFMTFVARVQNLLQGNFTGTLTNLHHACDRLVIRCAAPFLIGDETGYRPAVTGDDDCLAPLDVVQELGQVSLGLGSLNFAHSWLSTGRIDWSN